MVERVCTEYKVGKVVRGPQLDKNGEANIIFLEPDASIKDVILNILLLRGEIAIGSVPKGCQMEVGEPVKYKVFPNLKNNHVKYSATGIDSGMCRDCPVRGECILYVNKGR